MFCSECGKKVIETAKFCQHCGAKIVMLVEEDEQSDEINEISEDNEIYKDNESDEIVEVEEKNNEINKEKIEIDITAATGKTIDFSIGDRIIKFDENVAPLVKYQKDFHKYAELNANYFTKEMEVFTECIEDVLKDMPKMVKAKVETVVDKAIDILVSYGIFTVTKEIFIEKYQHIYFDYTSYFDDIKEQYLSIVATENERNEYKKQRRAKRGRWVGGGVGVKGAIGGAIMAGTLNVAMDMIRAPFYIASDMSDAKKINYAKEKLYSEIIKGKEVPILAQKCSFNVFMALVDELECQGIEHWSVFDITKAEALYENSKRIPDKEKRIEIILQCIKANPFINSWKYYDELFSLLPQHKNQIAKLANYFGSKAPEWYIEGKVLIHIQSILLLKENSFSDVILKLDKLFEKLRNHKLIDEHGIPSDKEYEEFNIGDFIQNINSEIARLENKKYTEDGIKFSTILQKAKYIENKSIYADIIEKYCTVEELEKDIKHPSITLSTMRGCLQELKNAELGIYFDERIKKIEKRISKQQEYEKSFAGVFSSELAKLIAEKPREKIGKNLHCISDEKFRLDLEKHTEAIKKSRFNPADVLLICNDTLLGGPGGHNLIVTDEKIYYDGEFIELSDIERFSTTDKGGNVKYLEIKTKGKSFNSFSIMLDDVYFLPSQLNEALETAKIARLSDEEQLKLAKSKFNKNNSQYFKIVKRISDNNPEAKRRLGYCYFDGKGVKKNYDIAISIFKECAKLYDDVEAMYCLGEIYEEIKKEKLSIEWYTKAAERGDEGSLHKLGEFYIDPEHCDYEKAILWFTKASEQYNSVAAQYNLGWIYEKALDNKNPAEAAKWYVKAANQGEHNSQNCLGVLYATGNGVIKDKNTAIYWLTKAAEQGNEMAKKNLKALKGGCYITTAVCQSFGKADDCYELQSFRKFRDDWLAHQNDGQSLIDEYYVTAPQIVNNINSLNSSNDIYLDIWHSYLEPCLFYIENNEFEQCKSLYVKMVRNLAKTYLQ